MNKTNKSGFTLVELAIVMIIIGLLIGGIMKGATLIEQAKVKSIISTIKETDAGVLVYEDMFAQLPGDDLNAQNRLRGCDAAASCLNGDGNKFIASDGTDHVAWTTNFISADRSTNGEETMQFWKHLAMADLLNIVSTTANTATPAWGETHPTSPFGGGFEIMYDGWMASGSGSGVSTHIIRLSDTLTGRAQPTLTPGIAFRIDSKIDDGDANTGIVIANYGRSSDTCKRGNRQSAVYDQSVNANACILYFKVQSLR